MRFFFGDDSRQQSPTRERMGALTAAGGIIVDGSQLRLLEKALATICAAVGIPDDQVFKWSPGRELWMHSNLIGQERLNFFKEVLRVARSHGVRALFVANDISYRTATRAPSHEEDVTATLLERIHHRTPRGNDGCIVIVDRPSGGPADQDRFLMAYMEQLQAGTRYVQHDRIPICVLSSPSKLIRCLQLADLVTSCSLARVSGEDQYSPEVFAEIRELFDDELDRRGGVSFKVHPDFLYRNLYHWLLGDEYFVRGNGGKAMPLLAHPYARSETRY